jgi:hypothetical protein
MIWRKGISLTIGIKREILDATVFEKKDSMGYGEYLMSS